MKGPRPQPTSVKLLRGNPGKRPVNRREPMPPPAVPRCPSHLSPEAKREWRRLAKPLLSLGLLSHLDRAALALYCQAWGRWVEAERQLSKEGMIVRSPRGYPIQSPYLAIANKAWQQVQQSLAEFGMSPSTRSRVVATGPALDSEKAKLAAKLFD